MGDISFPSNIKPLTSSNYSLKRGSNVHSSASGAIPQFNVDLSLEAVPFSLNFLLTAYQQQIMLMFYDNMINHGANSFNMRLDAGSGEEVCQCKIVTGTWKMVMVSHGNWSMSFTVVAESTQSQLEA